MLFFATIYDAIVEFLARVPLNAWLQLIFPVNVPFPRNAFIVSFNFVSLNLNWLLTSVNHPLAQLVIPLHQVVEFEVVAVVATMSVM